METVQNIKHKSEESNYEELSNIDAEIALIGCLLRENRFYEKIADFLAPEHFTNPLNSKLFSIISRLINQNQLVSPITLKNYFSSSKEDYNIDVFDYLKQIKDSTPSMINAFNYGRIIYDLHIRRSLLSIGQKISDDAQIKDSESNGVSQIEKAEQDLFNLSEKGSFERKYITLGEALKDAVETIDTAYKKDGKIAGIATGITNLDTKLGGMHKSDLIIIAGRPSMGKTALAFNIAENVARQTDQTVLIFSMEMSAEQVVRRFISSIANIDLQRLMRGQLQDKDWEGIDKALSILSSKNILLDDTPALSPTELRSRARRVKREDKDLAMIIVDYIGLMQVHGRSDNRVQEISEISRSLKALAKELDVPIVALSQLNRAVESRPNKRPILADLRDSGAIEQDADVIAFLYRHEYYDRNDLENKGKAEINIAKQRNGPTRTTSLAFRDSIAKFENLAREERYPTQYYEDNEDN